jgi:uncharacterized protein YraI
MSLRSFAIAAGTAIALTLPVQALAAYTTGTVNLRSGPGTGYGVIVTIPAGAPVGVQSCVPSWCQVSYAGFNGWMSAAFLGNEGGPAYVYPPDADAYPTALPPPYPYYPPYSYGGPSFGFYFGGPWHHHHW